MTTAPAITSATPTESELRRLLALRRADDVVTLLHLLENPPPDAPEAVVSLLARIAKDAQSSQALFVSLLVKAVVVVLAAAVIGFLGFVVEFEAFYFLIMLGLTVVLSMQVSAVVYAPERGRVAKHATLLLARVNDARAIQYLANVWSARLLTEKDAAFNADVSRELTRLLVLQEGTWFNRTTEKALRRVVDRAFPSGRIAKSLRRLRPAPDLTEADTDLLLAIVRHLSQPQTRRKLYTAEPLADKAALQRVSTADTPGANYRLLQETTQLLLKHRGGKS